MFYTSIKEKRVIMSLFGSIFSGLGSALGLGTSIANTISQNSANSDNMRYQQDVLDWQKQAQQIAWNREDNAVQRRVADLKSAGLSSTLAAGSSASSSSPVKIDAPQRKANQYNVQFDALQQMQMSQEFANKKAENDYIVAQADYYDSLAKQVKAETKVYNATYGDSNPTEPKSPLGRLAHDVRNNSVIQDFKTSLENSIIDVNSYSDKAKGKFKNLMYKIYKGNSEKPNFLKYLL